MEVDMDRNGQQDDELALNLYNNAMTGDWKKIVEIYNEHKFSAIAARINPSGDTVLHVAVAIAPEHIVKELIRVIKQTSELYLWIINNDGNTPLHVAASTGRLIICIILAKELLGFLDFQDELQNLGSQDSFRNKAGESPLFLAAFHGHKPSFVYLHWLFLAAYDKDIETSNPVYRRNDGETALHCAIRWEYFDMAYEILLVEPSLAYTVNQLGITPLHLLASKPSLFRSGSQLGWWKKIIYYCIYVEELQNETVRKEFIDSATKELDESSEIKDNNFPENYQTCIHFYQLLQTMSQFVIERKNMHCKGRNTDEESANNPNVTGQSKQKVILSKFILKKLFNGVILLKVIQGVCIYIVGLLCPKHNSLEIYIKEFMEFFFFFIKRKDTIILMVKTGKGETPKMTKTETPVLLAARNGITEMVEKILKESPLAINDKSEGKNIVHWAAMNRQPHVLQLLLKQDFVQRKLIHEVDTNNNNALHLAAEIEKKRPWLIPGAALQMQWELKWYEFVKSHMPQHICYQPNNDDKTPEEIFDDSHKDLVKEGGEWLDKTSESCSVVAALVATVAFAASTTIPGNINEESGSPNLENQPAITIFAISSLVALCFSITSLFTFLSILTSRYEQKDFRRDLPTKLLIGLTSLFVSIASMLVSFCAGHFFLLKNKLKSKAFPVYAVTCLPIVFFAIQQLPLYADILWAIYKKVPRSSNKAVLL
ncbi:hypothetical protein SO802_034448 [Lithocarpus litseifolius]|uniref:PGG domain-containing protein n=1 Tax=Lithocarpus litseifolius TaxID=425828 RepID=A0AAW2BH65_9ROSI